MTRSTAAASGDVPAPVRSTEPVTVPTAPPFDVVQKSISTAFVSPIAWFDRLFFSERDEIETNRSYMRLIGGTDWADGEGFRLRSTIKVKVRVPGIKQRLHLLISDDDEEDPEAGDVSTRSQRRLFSPNRAVSRLDPSVDDRRRAGIAYRALRFLNTAVDIETALRSQARGELSLRVRQQLRTWRDIRSRLYLTGFWLQGTGFGSRARMNFERPAFERTMIHWDNAVTQVHRVDGVTADTRLSWDIQVGRKAGVSPAFGMNGVTRPVWRMDTYLASVLYRRAFFRDWLFFELEPGINWTRDEFGARPPVPTFSVRIEMQFREEDE